MLLQILKSTILVAPWKALETASATTKAFHEYPIDRTIPDRVQEIVLFTSDNEADNGKEALVLFRNALGGSVINLPKHGHYGLQDMGTEAFPELLHLIGS